MAFTLQQAQRILGRYGQERVLRFWDRLDEHGRERLLAQIEAIDFETVERMREMLARRGGEHRMPTFEPAPVIELSGTERDAARRAGESLLRAGRVGVLLVAGGQGTRLGFEGPKGAFPLAPISGDTLFALHGRKIVALERKYRTRIPFYVMTSEANDGPTRAFFEQHDYFGLTADRVMFFVQGMWPALTEDGGMVLDRPDRIFMSPDGHGGVLAALRDRGALADMRARGLDCIFYFQVDNPLVDVADPVFLGVHRSSGAEASTKVCAKRDPDEGLGVVVDRGGRNAIVEYTELTPEQKRAVLPGGEWKFRFGSVAIHVFARDFLEREAEGCLPLHLAHKKVPSCNEAGETIEPVRPNAFKFEKFIFDSLPHADRWINLVFRRDDEFSPVKNAEGIDSPATARRDMMLKCKRMLEQCGVNVPTDAAGLPLYRIEIDPVFALTAEDLRERLPAGFRVEGDTRLPAPGAPPGDYFAADTVDRPVRLTASRMPMPS